MIGLILAASMLMADPTPADTSAPAPAMTAAAAGATKTVSSPGPKVKKSGMVCHTEEILGSRVPKRICEAPDQSADRRQQDRQELESMQDHNPGKDMHQ